MSYFRIPNVAQCTECTSVQAAAAIGKTFAVMAASISSCADDAIGKKCISSLVGSSWDMLRLLHFVVMVALRYAQITGCMPYVKTQNIASFASYNFSKSILRRVISNMQDGCTCYEGSVVARVIVMNTWSTAPRQLVHSGVPIQRLQKHIPALTNVHHPTSLSVSQQLMADSSVFNIAVSCPSVQKIITCRYENLPPTPT